MAATPMDIDDSDKLNMSLDDIIKTTKKSRSRPNRPNRTPKNPKPQPQSQSKSLAQTRKTNLSITKRNQVTTARKQKFAQGRQIATQQTRNIVPAKIALPKPVAPKNLTISITNDLVKNGPRRNGNGGKAKGGSRFAVQQEQAQTRKAPTGPLSSRFAQLQTQRAPQFSAYTPIRAATPVRF